MHNVQDSASYINQSLLVSSSEGLLFLLGYRQQRGAF